MIYNSYVYVCSTNIMSIIYYVKTLYKEKRLGAKSSVYLEKMHHNWLQAKKCQQQALKN